MVIEKLASPATVLKVLGPALVFSTGMFYVVRSHGAHPATMETSHYQATEAYMHSCRESPLVALPASSVCLQPCV